MVTRNDYLILKSILSESDENKGYIGLAGTTKKEIIEKTQLSSSKISNTLNMLEEKGYIAQGLKERAARTYIITEKGMSAIANLAGLAIKEEKRKAIMEEKYE